jgi:apolipoprotein N-acyltransferase
VIDAQGRWSGSLPVGVTARAAFAVPPAHPTIYDITGDAPWLLTITILGLCAVLFRGSHVRAFALRTNPAERS